MVFDWKTVPSDEAPFTKAYTDIAYQASKSGRFIKQMKYELQLNDWLKIELRWLDVDYDLLISVVRKVHKKAKYPEEWFEYPKEREEELFTAKARKMIDDLMAKGFVSKAEETVAMLVNNADYYVNVLEQTWTLQQKKEQNSLDLTVFDPTLRVASYVSVLIHYAVKIPLDNEVVPHDLAVILANPPIMPLTWLLGIPLIAKGFFPVLWLMHYPIYNGDFIMVRIPQEYSDKTTDIAKSVVLQVLRLYKEATIREQLRPYPVAKELLTSSIYPPAQVQLFVSDRGIFFEKPPEYEWYVALNYNKPRVDTASLLNMGAVNCISAISQLLVNA